MILLAVIPAELPLSDHFSGCPPRGVQNVSAKADSRKRCFAKPNHGKNLGQGWPFRQTPDGLRFSPNYLQNSAKCGSLFRRA